MDRREAITLLGSAGLITLLGISNTSENIISMEDNYSKTTGSMKTIGILGGFGPQATMDLEAQIHRAAQRIIPPMYNSGYPPMVVHYHRHAPVLLNKDFSPVLPLQPDPVLLDAARRLGKMVDFIIIPSNGVHLLQKEIGAAAGCMILSMIDATLDEVKKRQWKKIGVLGYGYPAVYTNRLGEWGIKFETIDDNLQKKLDSSIMKVMEGREDETDRKIALEAVNQLRAKKVDGIIPGCTEIPLLLQKNSEDGDLVNPAQLLAEAAVKYALS